MTAPRPRAIHPDPELAGTPFLPGEEALRFLAGASATLANSLDYETTLKAVARLMVPALADWCGVDLVDESGRLRRLAVTHIDPTREHLGWELDRRYPPRPEDTGGALHVLQTGRSEMMSDIPDELIAQGARDPGHLQLLREIGLVSYICAPMIARGRTVGVLSLVTSRESGRHYGPADLALAEEVASRAALAVDNAMLHEAERIARGTAERSAERAARLAAMATGMAQTQSLSEAAPLIARETRAVLQSDTAALYLLDVDQTCLSLLHAEGFAPGALEPFRSVGLDRDLSITEAVRANKPVFAETTEERTERYAETVAPGARLPTGAVIAAPLLAGDRCLGAICFTYHSARQFPAEERAFLTTLASLCAQVVSRTRLRDTEAAAIEALRSSERRLRTVIESEMMGIAFWNGERVTEANDALLRMLGYTREDVRAGMISHGRLTPPEYMAADQRATELTRSTGSCPPYEKEFFRKDGSRIAVLVGGATFGNERDGVFFVLDLTERRQTQEALEAAQRMDAVGRLAGGVAHEINNALQGVLGFSAFALRAIGHNEQARRDVEAARSAADRAASITRQLLAFSRRQLLRPVTVDLDQVIDEFTPMLRQALGAEHTLTHTRSAEPALVHADRGQLEQVLLNLALNARDAMGSAGRFSIATRTTDITDGMLRMHSAPPALRPGRFVELSVTDSGDGMSPAVRARVFEPFFTTKEPGSGTGLGLSVVHGIVQQSGGHIWVYSEPAMGTTFRIILPRAATAVAAAEQTARRRPAPALEAPATGATVLVVDDEPLVVEVAARLLRGAGYTVIEASEGGEALERMDAAVRAGQPVSVVVTDVVMPGMGGRELSREIIQRQRDGRLPPVRILHTSGYTGDEVVRRGLLAPDAAFIQKPFDPDELAERVGELVGGESVRV